MTWAQFKAAVKKGITVDAERLNTEDFLEMQIRQGVLDLQTFIPAYRLGHQTIYLPALNLTVDGYASGGFLPDAAQVRDVAYASTTEDCHRRPVNRQYPWEHRQDLICGHPRIIGGQFFMAIDPYAREFIVFPAVAEGFKLEVHWDGVKLDYADKDTVPYDEQTAQTVAKWVKAQIALELDNDATAYGAHIGNPMAPGTYIYLRRMLYLTAKAQTELAPQTSSPQPSSLCASCP